ncbi:unnamed protein product [Prorocentrum cordatum]|uniref:Sodium/calcium exchanger membrane region domain-containing protein n=1 Tax=Prorocentrum cordatum TaxID=2364126 RepID=A0ABN9QHP3_9DINO|nr:unnamed protein product [Polarella glacialis]
MAARRLALLAAALAAAAGASEPAALRAGAAVPVGAASPEPEGAGPEEGPKQLPEGSEPEEGGSSAVWPPWIEPGACNLGQLIFLTVVYGYVLYTASGMISEGSELLLVVPSIAGLVGSVVLPILGAVPDGMMVLFSGMGTQAQAQEQVSVGMGALAGSTVMLLTFPWFIAIYAGSVPIKDGKADYKSRTAGTKGLSSSGVKVDSMIKQTAKTDGVSSSSSPLLPQRRRPFR